MYDARRDVETHGLADAVLVARCPPPDLSWKGVGSKRQTLTCLSRDLAWSATRAW